MFSYLQIRLAKQSARNVQLSARVVELNILLDKRRYCICQTRSADHPARYVQLSARFVENIILDMFCYLPDLFRCTSSLKCSAICQIRRAENSAKYVQLFA